MKKEWKILSKEEFYKDKIRRFEKWQMETPSGTVANFTFTFGKDVVIVFGITNDDQVLLTREYFMLENRKVGTMVAGMIEKDDINQVAEAELREEGGCVAEEMIYLGKTLMSKYIGNTAHLFLAKGIKSLGKQELEESEDIDVEFVPLEEFKAMLRDGRIEPIFQVACAYKALDYLGKL